MKNLLLYLGLVVLLFSCKIEANEDFISSARTLKSGFSVTKLKVDSLNESGFPVKIEYDTSVTLYYNDTRPFVYDPSYGNLSKIYFHKKNEGYEWCYTIPPDSIHTYNYTYTCFDTLPIKFLPDTWYQMYGFNDWTGAPYLINMYINKNDSCKIYKIRIMPPSPI